MIALNGIAAGTPNVTGSSKDITGLLQDWGKGNHEALEELIPLVYEELRKMAGRYLRREPSGHTLQTTALVHEAYLRLLEQKQVQWQNRGHFFAIAAQAFRRILIDYARKQQALKRGGGEQRLPLDECKYISQQESASLVRLDEALATLAKIDSRQSRIVELRFFGGLTLEETAEVMEISTATVKREWSMARAWLYHEMTTGDR